MLLSEGDTRFQVLLFSVGNNLDIVAIWFPDIRCIRMVPYQ